jgi:hypothetical protein
MIVKNTKLKLNDISKSDLIYVDKVMGVGLGAGVSKIILGLEDENGVASPGVTLVLPTQALLELVELIDKTVRDNDALKTALTEQWRSLGEKFGARISPTPLVEQAQPIRRRIKQ